MDQSSRLPQHANLSTFLQDDPYDNIALLRNRKLAPCKGKPPSDPLSKSTEAFASRKYSESNLARDIGVKATMKQPK